MAGMLLMGMYWYVPWRASVLIVCGIKIRVTDMVGMKQSFGSQKIRSNDSTLALKK